LRKLLADRVVSKVGHDLKGQARLLHPLGLTVEGFGFDTDVAAYLIAPHRSDRDLPALMAQHFGESLPEEPARRAAAAARAVLRLRPILTEQLQAIGERDLFDQVEMPLAAILGHMERTGIAVDLARLDEIGDRLNGMMLAVSQRAYHLAGTEFNLDSPKQVAQVLFERLQLPRGRRTKTGWSTNADVLEELAPDHEIVALILQYREYAKLRSTYVEALRRLVSPIDGRVHTTFEQTVTATGRLSSRNPNLQNIPIRTDAGREIRSCFVAQGDGNVLLSADYSQIELRIMAHFSQEPRLLEAFRSGQDIHARTASEVFGVPLDAVTADMRRTAKTINYAVIYGMGAQALARQLGVKRTQAQEFIDRYFARLPGVREFLTQTVERAKANGFVTTLFGRRRPMPDLHASDPRTRAYAERAAANAPLQGTAADIIKIAMVRLAERLASWPTCRLLLQVHDELVFELPEDLVPQVAPVVREVMCGAARLDVPLEVEPKAGPNWRDMEPV
jgi:DNA polymerase-1